MPESKEYIRSSDEKGSINISEDVVAIIAATAAMEVDGVYSLYYAHSKEISHLIGRKGFARGVKLTIDSDDVSIDAHIVVELGCPVGEVGAAVQKSVMSAVEDAVGARVSAVNVHISGVAIKKGRPGQ